MKASMVLLAVVLLTACSTAAKRVDCTWRIEPINAPQVPAERGELGQ